MAHKAFAQRRAARVAVELAGADVCRSHFMHRHLLKGLDVIAEAFDPCLSLPLRSLVGEFFLPAKAHKQVVSGLEISGKLRNGWRWRDGHGGGRGGCIRRGGRGRFPCRLRGKVGRNIEVSFRHRSFGG